MAKAANERHWHISVPALIAAAALGAMPLFMTRVPWVAFACLTIAAFGIWSPHGPLMSWPAVILSGTNAASGDAQQQSSSAHAGFIWLTSSQLWLPTCHPAWQDAYSQGGAQSGTDGHDPHLVMLCCQGWQCRVKGVLLRQAALPL